MNFRLSIIFTWRFWIILLIILLIALFLFIRSSKVQVVIENLTPPVLPQFEHPRETVALEQNWDAETIEKFHYISQGTGTLPIPYDWLLALEQPERSPWGLLLPGGEPRFADPVYLGRYGFIQAGKTPENPDGLPVGFAKTPFQTLDGYPSTTTVVGLTCAACHTGRFTHAGTEYIVNGGPAVIDLQKFTKGLGAALGQTLFASKLPLPNRRFDRFAHNVLGEAYSETAKAQLAKNLAAVVEGAATNADTIEVVEGFGRLDALNRIGNQVFSKNTGRRENYVPIDAPVNYPHIWTASWFDWVQYDGSIMQPLVRNAGEALGVHAAINGSAPEDGGRFSSAVPIKNLKWIEDALAGTVVPSPDTGFGGLHGPAWPAALGAIDVELATKGEALYKDKCQGCHLPVLTSDEIWKTDYFRPITYWLVDPVTREKRDEKTRESYLALNIRSVEKMGTDPAQGDVLDKRTVNTAADAATGQARMGINTIVCAPEPRFDAAKDAGPETAGAVDAEGKETRKYALETLDAQVTGRGYDDKTGAAKAYDATAENPLIQVPVVDAPMLNYALALGALVQQVNDAWFDQNFIPAELRPYFEGGRPNCLQRGAGYKARPLNGVWATGPFLHNGSVPTLDDLLRPADERPRFVRLGDRAFDPIKVGVKQPDLSGDSYPPYVDGYFIMDTTLDGNRNTGHAFGSTADGDKTGVVGSALSDEERRALIEYLKTL